MQIQIASFYAKYFSWWLWLARNRRIFCGEILLIRRTIAEITSRSFRDEPAGRSE